jgi:hypothetical protein
MRSWVVDASVQQEPLPQARNLKLCSFDAKRQRFQRPSDQLAGSTVASIGGRYSVLCKRPQAPDSLCNILVLVLASTQRSGLTANHLRPSSQLLKVPPYPRVSSEIPDL